MERVGPASFAVRGWIDGLQHWAEGKVKMRGGIVQPSPKKALILPNINCVYCGDLLEDASRTKEHVIGNKFVPKNSLFGQWNLILSACRRCNNLKSDLEDDISAITMHADAFGQFGSEDERLRSEALRTAKGSFSRRTGNVVGESSERLKFSHEFAPGVTFTFEMSAPPQTTPERLYQLAYFHIQGFFFFITFNSVSKQGGFIPGIFKPILVARRADWGNLLMRSLTSSTRSWHLRFVGIAASGFFKVSIRRHSEGAEVWAWALEWNQNFRVVGFFGNEGEIDAQVEQLPKLSMKVLGGDKNTEYRMRSDIPLLEEDDDLFTIAEP